MNSSWQEALLRVLWYGGSTFDAWLNLSSAKMSARITTLPQSTTQVGLVSGILFQFFNLAIGVWIQRVLCSLYLKYKDGVSSTSFTTSTQLHEVIGGLLGPRWKAVSFLVNTATLFFVSSIQILNGANIVYVLDNRVDKRTWTSVLSAVFFLSILIPSAHNYRVWSFIGVISTIFVSGYLTVATILHQKVHGVKHTSPHSSEDYFRGVSGLITLGHVVIPIEIMDAMWKPEEYSAAYGYSQVFVLLVAAFPSFTMNRRFGDTLLEHPNAFLFLPASRYRDAAIILLLVHLFINFGMFSLPVYAIWEKIFGVHSSPSYVKRTLTRIPVFLAFWLTALAFPFFGIVNKVFDATLVILNLYVIPCAAYIVFFRPREIRQRSEKWSTFGWVIDFSLSFGVILWVLVVDSGLALWGNAESIRKTKLQLFAKCYSC